jgi:hypothetical protein
VSTPAYTIPRSVSVPCAQLLSDAFAQWSAAIELMNAMFMPLTRAALSVWFCEPDLLGTGAEYLTVNPTIECKDKNGETNKEYEFAYAVSIAVFVSLFIGLPLVMHHAQSTSIESIENRSPVGSKRTIEIATTRAKHRFKSTWKLLPENQKTLAIESALGDLREDLLGRECFMMTNLQMCMTFKAVGW